MQGSESNSSFSSKGGANSSSKKFYKAPRGKKFDSKPSQEQPAEIEPPSIVSKPPSNIEKPSQNKDKLFQKYKIIIRKLPASREFTKEQFEQCLNNVLTGLSLDASQFQVDHFIEGKIR
jgi:hypothetical protein